MCLVASQFEIFEHEIIDPASLWIELDLGQRVMIVRQLLVDLFEVIQIQMRVTEAVDKVTWI